MSEANTLQVSLSAFQTWQRCEYKYYLSYVRRLRKTSPYPAPMLGRVLHSYFEHFYTRLMHGAKAGDAHLAAQLESSNEFIPEINPLITTLVLTGNEELAREMQNLIPLASRLTDRYFRVRGQEDAERYEVLLVEQWMKLQIFNGINSVGVVDLVTRDRQTGRINLWEHKSTQNVPENAVRLRDFQTMLYGTKLRWLRNITVDSIIWNYTRTKEPVTPEVLKSGALTKRKDLDSTWEHYVVTAMQNDVDPFDPAYYEVKERLDGREETVFFPRYEVPVVTDEAAFMNDYIEEAKRIKKARMDWSRGVSTPIKTIMRDCDYCEYFRICQASLTGGDVDDAIAMGYTSAERS